MVSNHHESDPRSKHKILAGDLLERFLLCIKKLEKDLFSGVVLIYQVLETLKYGIAVYSRLLPGIVPQFHPKALRGPIFPATLLHTLDNDNALHLQKVYSVQYLIYQGAMPR